MFCQNLSYCSCRDRLVYDATMMPSNKLNLDSTMATRTTRFADGFAEVESSTNKQQPTASHVTLYT